MARAESTHIRGFPAEPRRFVFEPDAARGLARRLQSVTVMDTSKPRRSVLTVARVGAVLVDLESGATLGSYSAQPGLERRKVDEDEGITDLPSVVPNPRTKSSRSK